MDHSITFLIYIMKDVTVLPEKQNGMYDENYLRKVS